MPGSIVRVPYRARQGYSGLTEILFIGRDDHAEATVQAALQSGNYGVRRVRTVTEANDLLAHERFDALIIDFDDAGSGPGFDLAQLLGLSYFCRPWC